MKGIHPVEATRATRERGFARAEVVSDCRSDQARRAWWSERLISSGMRGSVAPASRPQDAVARPSREGEHVALGVRAEHLGDAREHEVAAREHGLDLRVGEARAEGVVGHRRADRVGREGAHAVDERA